MLPSVSVNLKIKMKEEIKKFKERNGNNGFTQKDMIMYIITKVDCIDQKLNEGIGKIATNQANIKSLYWFLGIFISVIITIFGIISL